MNSLVASPEGVSLARKFLMEDVPTQKDWIGSTNFAVITKGKEAPHLASYLNSICHASLGTPRNNIECVATEIAISRRKHNYPEEGVDHLLPLLRYILSESLWSDYIIEKDFDFCKDYGLIIDASCPANMHQALAITSRFFWEVSLESFELFNKLILEVPERVAFILAFHTSISRREYTYKEETTKGINKPEGTLMANPGHRPFSLLGFGGLDNFLKGSFTKGAPYRSSQNIYGVSNSFGPCRLIFELFQEDEFKERLRSMRQGGTSEGYRPPNPFVVQPKKPREGEITIKEYLDVAIPFLIEKFSIKGGTLELNAA